ncbi:MAG: branched-chain amino acid aminotransferase [Pseudomonadota bacterium]
MAVIPFDDRDGFIWYDGRLIPWRDSKIHVLTHGLHYGSCVFEGERAYGGKVFKLTEHSERLVKSGEILGMKIPYSVAEIDAATTETLKASGIADAYIRPVAWRGSEMMGVAAQKNTIHLAIAVWAWPSYWSPEARMQGIRLNISEWRRPHPQTAPTASKAAGLYMICTMSKHKAESEGFEDSMMLDWRGQVAEATGANIFFVMNGELHTPLPDCFLNGITRQTVIGLARANGLKVVERAIMPEELTNATECFLTGTAAEVTPVREIGPYRFTPGHISRKLISDYDALVRA